MRQQMLFGMQSSFGVLSSIHHHHNVAWLMMPCLAGIALRSNEMKWLFLRADKTK
jgi:hypothetical protein